MKKTEQVRIPTDLMHEVRWIAPLLGESATDYVARLVAEGVKKDAPRAANAAAKRAKHTEEGK
jgi:hypothetical protein